ncbi:hypothetical protein SporoS204_05325 [Sporosarcina ureae]|uniref:Type II toxin-antitoxin system RelE/ParE family toxin n=1 Tax=Sporosarcina ureae TaxID=1571 RepID=A0ABM6JTS1_SPOUR|nr:hypothetical protein SporoS204_05325 [Sporosarcina ureae]
MARQIQSWKISLQAADLERIWSFIERKTWNYERMSSVIERITLLIERSLDCIERIMGFIERPSLLHCNDSCEKIDGAADTIVED